MSVSAHLRIQIDEYDARIRTFVPWYEQLIATTAQTLQLLEASSPTIVDLGIGTGALAAKCLEIRPEARLVGIDSDEAMLEVARSRLAGHSRIELIHGDFREVALPPCDAIVACIALHHIKTPVPKQALYAACSAALRPGGYLVSGDCFPAREARLAVSQRELWVTHLEQFYPRAEAEGYLAAWADEDTYFLLEDELQWLRGAGLTPEVVWREGGFAVVMAGRVDGSHQEEKR